MKSLPLMFLCCWRLIVTLEIDAPVPYELTWHGQDGIDAETCSCEVVTFNRVRSLYQCETCGTVYELDEFAWVIGKV